MSLERLGRISLPCRDLPRQRDFYTRVLGLKPRTDRPDGTQFAMGDVQLVLRSRGDALFPRDGGPGVMLAFAVPNGELDRWYRRLLTNRVAVLDPPHEQPGGGRALWLSDPEGNVIELFSDE